MSSTLIISIDGNIGSGKSTLYSDLQKHYADNEYICFVPEPVEEWKSIVDQENTPILTNLYKDTKKFAFRFQMMAYISRLHLLRQKVKENKYSIIISERCVQTDKNVFAQMLFDDNMIEHDEFQIYLNWFDEFLDDIKLGGIIYVKAEPSICDSRVKIRAREGETIPLDYLVKCHEYHENWLNNIDTPTLLINADLDTNIPENKEIRESWLQKIDNWIQNINTVVCNKNEINNNQLITSSVLLPSSCNVINNNEFLYTLHFDGACRGNPSNILGLGAIIYDQNNIVIASNSRKCNMEGGTNNIAEYLSLIDGLRLAQSKKIDNILVEGDSQLIINQINGIYKVNSPILIRYYTIVKKIMDSFVNIQFRHIRREFNKNADSLANKALDDIEEPDNLKMPTGFE
jgi:deoxyadenosine/deoxycytidine kinase/ribonuclease HI